MNIFNIFEFIASYGWGSVLIVVCCCGVLLIFKYLLNRLENNVERGIDNIATKLSETTTEQNKILINTINNQNEKLLDIIIDNKQKENDEYHGKLTNRMISTESINLYLRDIGHKYKADRVSILEFHNSSQNLIGIPFAKYSCNFEWINKGTISLQAKCQSLPFSMISEVVTDIRNSGGLYVVYYSIEHFAETSSGFYTVLKECNIKSLIYVPLYDNDNKIIGLIALEYHYTINENDININALLIDVEHITTILSLKHVKQNVQLS